MHKILFALFCIILLSCKKNEEKFTQPIDNTYNEIGLINSQDPLHKTTTPILVNKCVEMDSLANFPISCVSIIADSFDLKHEHNLMSNADFSRMPILNDNLFGKNVLFVIAEQGIITNGSIGSKKQFHELYSPKPILLTQPEFITTDDLYPIHYYGEDFELKWIPDNNNNLGIQITLSWTDNDKVNTFNLIVPDNGATSIKKIYFGNIPTTTPAYIDIKRKNSKLIILDSDNYNLVSESVISFTFLMKNR